MRKQATNRSVRGFTLVETLVVVAVVALLMALLLPALASARKSGRSAVCLSNLRQAFGLYKTNSSFRLPRAPPSLRNYSERPHGLMSRPVRSVSKSRFARRHRSISHHSQLMSKRTG
ncbi:MAG: prepilin-type N-terminal cleavage/methylation domain-containing protein [Bryobacteraceae bacterium]|nr:prepilin-type N-terminal cleavage/methylation domain-containing protein [Bryobacteraceae bacterium]